GQSQTAAAGTGVAAASSATRAVTVSRPTLPPSWTPLPSPTTAAGVLATPMASPPPGLIGRLVAKSGVQRTSDENLPMFILSRNGTRVKPVRGARGGKDPARGD